MLSFSSNYNFSLLAKSSKALLKTFLSFIYPGVDLFDYMIVSYKKSNLTTSFLCF